MLVQWERRAVFSAGCKQENALSTILARITEKQDGIEAIKKIQAEKKELAKPNTSQAQSSGQPGAERKRTRSPSSTARGGRVTGLHEKGNRFPRAPLPG